MRTILTARISTLIVGLVRGFLSSLRFAESSVCESCGLNISVRAVGGTSGSGLTIDCQPPNALPFSLSVEVTADARLLILCACSRSGNTKSVRGSGGNDGIYCSLENYVKWRGPTPTPECSRCKERSSVVCHRLASAHTVRPKYPYLCGECVNVILASGEVV